jgi:transposase-like protein
MVKSIRKKAHSAEFKFKVALAAIKADKTMAELCQEFGIANSQLHKWRKALLDNGAEVFKNTSSAQPSVHSDIDKLHATIGRLKVENDFLERVLGRSR